MCYPPPPLTSDMPPLLTAVYIWQWRQGSTLALRAKSLVVWFRLQPKTDNWIYSDCFCHLPGTNRSPPPRSIRRLVSNVPNSAEFGKRCTMPSYQKAFLWSGCLVVMAEVFVHYLSLKHVKKCVFFYHQKFRCRHRCPAGGDTENLCGKHLLCCFPLIYRSSGRRWKFMKLKQCLTAVFWSNLAQYVMLWRMCAL